MLPALPVVLRHSVFDRHDRIAAAPFLVELDETRCIKDPAFAFEVVLPVLEKLARSGVECDRDVLARSVACSANRLDDQLQRVLVGRKLGREASLVPHSCREALRLEHVLQRVVHLRCRAKRLTKSRRADSTDHELLQIDRRVCMRTSVEDVCHRQRKERCAVAAEVSKQRDAFRVGGGVRHRERHAEDRVRAEPRFVRRAVETLDPFGDLTLHVGDRLRHPLAAVSLGVAVAQLDRLV